MLSGRCLFQLLVSPVTVTTDVGIEEGILTDSEACLVTTGTSRIFVLRT